MNCLVYVLLVLLPVVQAVFWWNDEARLVSYLWVTAGYDAGTRPVRNASDTVVVALRTDVFSILNLDSKEEEIKVASAFSMRWEDERLAWDPDVYNSLEQLSVPAGKIWYPKLKVLNALEETRLITDDSEMLVTKEGVLYVTQSTIFNVQCHLEQSSFPFDVQVCTFLVGTSGVPRGILWLNASKIDKPRESVQAISSWNLEDLTVEEVSSPSCIDTHLISGREAEHECQRTSQASVALTLRRVSDYYVYTVLVPCSLLTVLASMIFWLPTECGEKLSYGISIFFGFVIFQLLVQDNLSEAGGEKPSVLIRYVLFNFVLVGWAVMTSALSIALYHRGDGRENSQSPALCKNCTPLAQVGMTEDPQPTMLSQDSEEDAVEHAQSKAKKPWNWKKIAKYLDRVSFFVYCGAFFAFFVTIVLEVTET